MFRIHGPSFRLDRRALQCHRLVGQTKAETGVFVGIHQSPSLADPLEEVQLFSDLPVRIIRVAIDAHGIRAHGLFANPCLVLFDKRRYGFFRLLVHLGEIHHLEIDTDIAHIRFEYLDDGKRLGTHFRVSIVFRRGAAMPGDINRGIRIGKRQVAPIHRSRQWQQLT